jgi:DNA modification methylase
MDNVTLLNGDCLEKMKDIPDGSVDMVLCDTRNHSSSYTKASSIVRISY